MAQGHAMQLVSPNVKGDASPDSQETIPASAGGDSLQTAAGVGSDQGAGNIEKIRDILFGNHIREYGIRFTRLEESLLKQSAELRDSTDKRFEHLETFVRNEFEALQARLKSERENRDDLGRQFARDLAALGDALTRRVNDLDEQTSQTDRQLRLELLQRSKDFTEDLRRRQEELVSVLDNRFRQLHKGKTDRTALATLFTELAMGLAGESEPAGVER